MPRPRPITFQGRNAVITGAASGLGLALSHHLAALGAHVWMADINTTAVEAAADAVRKHGAPAHARTVDVTDRVQFGDLLHEVHRGSGLDLLINNAGIGGTLPFDEATPAHWDRILQLNLHSVIEGTTVAYDLMRARGHGQIANVASISGLVPVPLQTLYNTTKYAVVGLSASLRPEATAHGVRISVICPGNVATAIFGKPILGEARDDGGAVPQGGASGVPRDAVSAETAARVIVRGLVRDDATIVFPQHARTLAAVHRHLPVVSQRVLAGIYRQRVRSRRDVPSSP